MVKEPSYTDYIVKGTSLDTESLVQGTSLDTESLVQGTGLLITRDKCTAVYIVQRTGLLITWDECITLTGCIVQGIGLHRL